MFYVIHSLILHNTLPDSFLFEIYIYILFKSDSTTSPALYLYIYWCVCALYTGVCIDMFVYVIKSTNRLYFILGVFFYISPVNGLFYHCVVVTSAFVSIYLWTLYLCLLWYVYVLHTIYYLILIRLGKRVIYFLIYYSTVSILVGLYSQYWINTYLFGFTIDMSHVFKHIYALLIYWYLIYFLPYLGFLVYLTLKEDLHFSSSII